MGALPEVASAVVHTLACANKFVTHASEPFPRLQQELVGILQRVSGVDAERIQPGARLIEDIGLDSLGFYEILIEADETFGIRIPEEALLQFRTVDDIQSYLQSMKRSDAQPS